MKYLLLFASLAYGQTTINAPAVQLTAVGEAAVLDYLGTQQTGIVTTLSTSVDALTTSIEVESGQGITVGATIKIDSEHMSVTAKSGRTLTVTRGFNRTTAAAHTGAVAGDTPTPGAEIRELRFRTINALAKNAVMNLLRQAIENYPPLSAPIQQAQAEKDAAIAAARAAKDAAIQAAVQ